MSDMINLTTANAPNVIKQYITEKIKESIGIKQVFTTYNTTDGNILKTKGYSISGKFYCYCF